MKEKIQAFAVLLESQLIQRLKDSNLACEANIQNNRVHIHEGKKYTRIDTGGSGKYMVENSTGNIFGIKGYGVVHKGHFYGTLDTTSDYFWGGFYPERISAPLPKQKFNIPALTFAPPVV